jgi:hypothetical protein
MDGSRIKASLIKYFKKPYLQNNQSKMGWRLDSCRGVPPLQAWSPEFKLQFQQKKKERKCGIYYNGILFSVKKAKPRAGGMAQVVKNLPSKHEALSSNPRTTQKNKSKTGSGMAQW